MSTLILLLAALSQIEPAAASGAADSAFDIALDISPPVLDFGVVGRDHELQRRVRLINRGSKELTFGGIDSDCVCLRGCPLLQRLAPGASHDWPITLHTCDYTGEVRRSVWIDSPTGKRTIPTRYRVVEAVYCAPGTASFGIIAAEDAAERELALAVRTVEAGVVRLLGAQSSDPQHVLVELAADCVTRDAPAEIRIRLVPPLPAIAFGAQITVHTDDADVPTLRIPTRAEVVPGVHSEPATAEFAPIAWGQAGRTRLTLIVRPGVEVRDIRTAGDLVSIAGVERSPQRTVVDLAAPASLPLGEFASHLRIDLFEAGRTRQVHVPIRGQVVEPQ